MGNKIYSHYYYYYYYYYSVIGLTCKNEETGQNVIDVLLFVHLFEFFNNIWFSKQ